MASYATWSRIALLSGCIWLAGQVPGSAQSEQKLSKPLNLSEFAKSSAVRAASPSGEGDAQQQAARGCR